MNDIETLVKEEINKYIQKSVDYKKLSSEAKTRAKSKFYKKKLESNNNNIVRIMSKYKKAFDPS